MIDQYINVGQGLISHMGDTSDILANKVVVATPAIKLNFDQLLGGRVFLSVKEGGEKAEQYKSEKSLGHPPKLEHWLTTGNTHLTSGIFFDWMDFRGI